MKDNNNCLNLLELDVDIVYHSSMKGNSNIGQFEKNSGKMYMIVI